MASSYVHNNNSVHWVNAQAIGQPCSVFLIPRCLFILACVTSLTSSTVSFFIAYVVYTATFWRNQCDLSARTSENKPFSFLWNLLLLFFTQFILISESPAYIHFMQHARSFKSNLHHANSSWRIHLRCVMIIRTLTEKIKEQSVGFSQIVSTFKTWERHLCKVPETWGQFTAGSNSAKYSKDSVTSKTNHKTCSRPKHTILLHHVMKQRTGEKN